MKIKYKLLTLFLLLSLIPMLFVSTIIYLNSIKIINKQVIDELTIIANIKEQQIKTGIKQAHSILHSISSRKQLRDDLDNYLKTGDEEKLASIEEIVGIAANSLSDTSSSISIFSKEGDLVYSNGVGIAKHISLEEISSGKKLITKVNNKGLIGIYTIEKIYLDDDLIGYTVMQLSDTIIDQVTKDESPSKSLETIIATKSDNGDSVYISKLRSGNHDDAKPVIPKEDLDVPMTRALAKEESAFIHAIDYTDQKVFAVTRYLEEQDWGLVVKIDTSESRNPIIKLQNLAIFIGFVALFIIMLIAYFVAKSISDPIESLKQVADDISKGKLNSNIEETVLNSQDETGDLARAFERTVVSLKLAMKYGKHTKEDLTKKIDHLKESANER